MTIRLCPALHASVLVDFPLEDAPRTKCYDHVILPCVLKIAYCQHPDGGPWGLNLVELEGFLVYEGEVTHQAVTARYELDESDDPMPVWVQPLLDQVQADLDRRERLA